MRRVAMRRLLLLCTLLMTIPTNGIAEEKTPAVATFAGGCFWCMQPPFDNTPGVTATSVGYSGGAKQNPSYDEVSAGRTEHAEAIQVEYDPEKVSYETLLDVFWKNIDPTQENGQFADKGKQYRTAIFYHTEAQQQAAIASKKALEASQKFSEPIVVAIEPASSFYDAEDYHQKYYTKNPEHYKRYKIGSGRASFIERVWGKKTK